MVNIRGIDLIARLLGTNRRRLISIAEAAPQYCEDLILIDPSKPGKIRDVVNPIGPLRRMQARLYHALLAPNHRPSWYSHGGVRGRSVKTNAEPHLCSAFVFATDIANFYPSVHYTRVYQLFIERFFCSPDVARICTKLCTHRYRLAQGLITSPILADCLMSNADMRIARMCARSGLVYTRFVDDITISGLYPVDSGSFPKLVADVLKTCGFALNAQKEVKGRLSAQNYITKLRIKRGRLDVRPAYLAEIHSQLDDAARLSRGGEWTGTYHTCSQILGRIHYIGWINPGRRQQLMKRYKSIPWKKVEEEARARGLVAQRKVAIRKPAFHE
jgi:hypothetical protein